MTLGSQSRQENLNLTKAEGSDFNQSGLCESSLEKNTQVIVTISRLGSNHWENGPASTVLEASACD